MSISFNKTLSETDFLTALERVKTGIRNYGFGVVTEIDMKKNFREKLDRDFREYRILGVCNPAFAYRAIQHDDKLGVFLPCNLILQQYDDGRVELSAVDPVASMMALNNPSLGEIAEEVQVRLKQFVEEI